MRRLQVEESGICILGSRAWGVQPKRHHGDCRCCGWSQSDRGVDIVFSGDWWWRIGHSFRNFTRVALPLHCIEARMGHIPHRRVLQLWPNSGAPGDADARSIQIYAVRKVETGVITFLVHAGAKHKNHDYSFRKCPESPRSAYCIPTKESWHHITTAKRAPTPPANRAAA